jgi:hypothetical protein
MIVYWASFLKNKQVIRFNKTNNNEVIYEGVPNNSFGHITYAPKLVSKNYLKIFSDIYPESGNRVHKCPAVIDDLKNLFEINMPFDYNLKWDGEGYFSTEYFDQDMFDQMLHLRSPKFGICSLVYPRYIMFAEKSLEVSILPAYFSECELNEKTIFVAGKYDIGKHFRSLEMAVKFKKPDTITIKENDPLYYLRFHTNEKIEFKRFYFTEELRELSSSILFLRNTNRTETSRPLSYYYDMFRQMKYKNYILRKIKENLME